MSNPEDLKLAHEIDQALAESIELGYMRIVGKNSQGDDELKITAKGVLNVTVMLIQGFIEHAKIQKRDFTSEEKQDIVRHLLKAALVLQEEDEHE